MRYGKPSSEILAKVLLLALQTTDPGASFVEIAEVFRTELAEQGEDAILGRISQVTANALEAVTTRLMDESIGLEVEAFGKRGSGVHN